MEHALRKWDKKAQADKTWKKCKSYFSKEYADRCKHAAIETKQTPFGHANQALENNKKIIASKWRSSPMKLFNSYEPKIPKN